MQGFSIVKESCPSNSFRVESIKGKFDLQVNNIIEKFDGVLDLNSRQWRIGVIYGASGTGKSTIAENFFSINNHYNFNSASVIDDMPQNKTIDEITNVFNSVGFSTCWSWLKPYNVLSNGEKMRVQIAYELLSDKDVVCFDEYTSVVSRDVAKMASCAISKYIKRTKKKFIAVSCHDDVIDWLEPDWVFNTDLMRQEWEVHQRPEIELQVYETPRQTWELFKKYHYLNHKIDNYVKSYIALWKNNPVGFIAIMHFPHPIVKNIIRCCRLVVLPDYQGCGIGTKLLNCIASKYKNEGYQFRIITSQTFLSKALQKNHWVLTEKSRRVRHGGLGQKMTYSSDRIKSTLVYTG